jgi:cobalamin biosynthesis Mg chelatase CobN
MARTAPTIEIEEHSLPGPRMFGSRSCETKGCVMSGVLRAADRRPEATAEVTSAANRVEQFRVIELPRLNPSRRDACRADF